MTCQRILFGTRLYSSLGNGNPRPPPEDGGDDNGLGDFLTPKDESEGLKRAREYMAETSLPISFDLTKKERKEKDNDIDDDDDEDEDEDEDDDVEYDEDEVIQTVEKRMKQDSSSSSSSSSSAMVNSFGSASSSALFRAADQPSPDVLARNPYMQVVSKLSPSDLISKFTATTSPRVQEAVRATILGLIGSLPKMAFETTTITTGQRLASLMFQLQMTGYMFKNAEYRLSLSQSLGIIQGQSSSYLLTGTDVEHDGEGEEDDPLLNGKIRGKVKIRYGGSNGNNEEEQNGQSVANATKGLEMEIDAAAYMSELRAEVAKLKEELTETREAKEEALRKDLLLYIRTLPAQELRSLTSTMSQDVLVCMKGLVSAVLAGIGAGC